MTLKGKRAIRVNPAMPSTLSTALKDRRAKARLTQAGLATLIGCSTDTIMDIETGRRAPRKETVWEIGAALCLCRTEVLAWLGLASHHRKNRPSHETDYVMRTATRHLSRSRR